MKHFHFLYPLIISILFISACNTPEPVASNITAANETNNDYQRVLNILSKTDQVKPPHPDIHPVRAVYNQEAVIPPMCYTQTEGKHNPCYVCHQDTLHGRENVMNDRNLQEAYSFSDLGMTNHWQNLFEDRRQQIANISDEEIIQWINTDNYSELAPRLREVNFKGWIPDLQNLQLGAGAFDNEGFAKDGSHWVAFNYKPFPSTFWPTNGSTDDVMIRLPEPYRHNKQGQYSRDIYKANLAIVEANIKGVNSISSLPINEKAIGIDLNKDGKLTTTTHIATVKKYVGAAEEYFLDTFLYPEGTQFLHTVRYVGFDNNGDISVSPRMKEVRYMKKWKSYPKVTLARYYQDEAYAKDAGNLPSYPLIGDHGLDNEMGWSVQGFMENKNGRLRVTTYEENLFCMGCHGSIGATIDKTFSFARKVDGTIGWGYINLKGMPDAPNKGESKGEILTYFERAGGGDEFRSNPEMYSRWFNKDGSVNKQAMQGKDVYQLITPSRQRALTLNKAYKVLVDKQHFIYGRDATATPPQNVYHKVENETSPTLREEHIFDWDIRLDWNRKSG